MKKVLFWFKRIYLRFEASYPKALNEEEMLKKGEHLWNSFTTSKNTEESTKNFQKYAFNLSSGALYSLQEYLRAHLSYLENNRIEHSVGREEQMESEYIEKIKLHLHAIC